VIPRAVLDSNVAISTLLFTGGWLAWMRPAWQQGRFLPLAGRETLDELLRVLGYPKFGLDADEIIVLLGDYVPWVEVLTMIEVPGRDLVAPDPDDQKFLDLAAAGSARYLVTGDAGLLTVPSSGPLEIVTPEAFRTLMAHT
jgi:putative PIN family toxin of toxin-antitoxin system